MNLKYISTLRAIEANCRSEFFFTKWELPIAFLSLPTFVTRKKVGVRRAGLMFNSYLFDVTSAFQTKIFRLDTPVVRKGLLINYVCMVEILCTPSLSLQTTCRIWYILDQHRWPPLRPPPFVQTEFMDVPQCNELRGAKTIGDYWCLLFFGMFPIFVTNCFVRVIKKKGIHMFS